MSKKLTTFRFGGQTLVPLAQLAAAAGIPAARRHGFYVERLLKQHKVAVTAKLPIGKSGRFRAYVSKEDAQRLLDSLSSRKAPTPAPKGMAAAKADSATAPAAAGSPTPATVTPVEFAALNDRLDNIVALLTQTRSGLAALAAKVEAGSSDTSLLLKAHNMQATRVDSIATGIARLLADLGVDLGATGPTPAASLPAGGSRVAA